jgi:hypothetical protein
MWACFVLPHCVTAQTNAPKSTASGKPEDAGKSPDALRLSPTITRLYEGIFRADDEFLYG